jgi:hypothetical protein
MNSKLRTRVLAVAMGMAISGGALALADPSSQDHEQNHEDYSKDKEFQQGMHDGRNDRAHNRDHSKKRHFKKVDDQKSYDAGYQWGRGN